MTLDTIELKPATHNGVDHKIKTSHANVVLDYRQVYNLEGDQRGTEITSLEGNVWITQKNDFTDHVLEAGESYIISRPGMVLIQALEHAALQIKPGKILPTDRVANFFARSNN
jgi:hypothetical protein